MVASQRLNREAKYIRAEQLHVKANDRWTKARPDGGPTRWVNSLLASVVINATPGANVPPFATSKSSLIRALEIRANYRLCGALFMAGDGARKPVLGLIDDAKCTYF